MKPRVKKQIGLKWVGLVGPKIAHQPDIKLVKADEFLNCLVNEQRMNMASPGTWHELV